MSLDRIHVYELTDRVEGAGPGRLYRARVVEAGGPLPIESEVHVIVVDADEAGGEDTLRDLVHSHGIARQIEGGNVVAPVDFGMLSSGGERRFWAATPAVPGRSLEALLDDVGAIPDALTEALAIAITEAVEKLQAAGLFAVGVDPARIIVRDDSSVAVVGVGLGPVLRWAVRQDGADERSRRCVAPELFETEPRPSKATDLFAIGAVLYRCISGEWYDPLVVSSRGDGQSRRPNDVKHEASIFLSEVVHELLEPSIDMRLETAEDLWRLLHERRESTWWQGRHIDQGTQGVQDETESADIREPEPPPIPPPAPPPEPEWFEERRQRRGGFALHPARCVGRDGELAVLLERIRALREDGGSVVLVEGEPGVGKTRLLDELLRRAAEIPDLVVLHGEHRPRGIGRPMQAFTEALTRWVAGSRRDVTAEDVRPLLGEATAMAPDFAAFLSSAATPARAERLTRESLGSAFLQCLRTLSRDGPVLFVVEDLQWADPEGLDLFGHIARSCEVMPLLLIGSHRPPAERSTLHALTAALSVQRRFRAVPLAPLGGAGWNEVAHELLKPPSAARALLEALPPETERTPAVLVEAAKLLEARGQLVASSESGWVASDSFSPAGLPGHVDELVDERLSPLSETEREALSVACVQGLVFDAKVARRAAGLRADVAEPLFAELARRAFIHGERPVWRFSSNALFDRVYDTLSDEQLVSAHEATADAFLASRNPDQLPPSEIHGILSYRVAWHYLLAGRETRGLLYVSAALEHLRDTWRIGDAERLSELACRALAKDPGRKGELIELLTVRADLLGMQGRRVEQRETLDEALLRACDVGDAVFEGRVILESARLRLVIGQLERARDEAREALRVATEAEDARLEARCLQLLGTVAFREGRFQEARTHMQHVLELSRRIRDEDAEAEALQTLGSISQDVGSWMHAEELQRQAMGIYRRAGDLGSEAEVLSSLGGIATATDDPVRAEQYLRRALAIHRALGDGHGRARVLGLLGLLMQDAWRLADAQEFHEASCQASREVGARQEELASLINLASTEYLLGRLLDGRDHYGDALRAAREIGDARLEGYALTGLADVARQLGELTVAEGLAERAISKLNDADDTGGLAAALLASGRVSLLIGDDERAASTLGRAVELSRAARTGSVTAVGLALQGLLAAREGDIDTSSVSLLAAREELATDKGIAPALVEVVFIESLALRVRRDPAGADRLLLEADELLTTMTEGLREPDRDTFVHGSSPAREIRAGAAAARGARAPTP
jgi:tetratricopeptide (TPR) repeat protein